VVDKRTYARDVVIARDGNVAVLDSNNGRLVGFDDALAP